MRANSSMSSTFDVKESQSRNTSLLDSFEFNPTEFEKLDFIGLNENQINISKSANLIRSLRTDRDDLT